MGVHRCSGMSSRDFLRRAEMGMQMLCNFSSMAASRKRIQDCSLPFMRQSLDRQIQVQSPHARAGFDVNFMRKPDYFTPLHCALKLKKSSTALALIEHGADVNAVAEGDVMPLPLALAARAESSDEGIEKCIEVLRAAGARESWRFQ